MSWMKIPGIPRNSIQAPSPTIVFSTREGSWSTEVIVKGYRYTVWTRIEIVTPRDFSPLLLFLCWLMCSVRIPAGSHTVAASSKWYTYLEISWPVGCSTGPTTLDFTKFNISRPRNYGLMDFTTESLYRVSLSPPDTFKYILFEICSSNLPT